MLPMMSSTHSLCGRLTLFNQFELSTVIRVGTIAISSVYATCYANKSRHYRFQLPRLYISAPAME